MNAMFSVNSSVVTLGLQLDGLCRLMHSLSHGFSFLSEKYPA